jgi:RNA polymerase sigma-70 factor (ECF subfamily)
MKAVLPDEQKSDADLLAAYAKGDVRCLDLLVARYRQALFSWFLGMTGSRSDAEDLFQEVWIRIIRNADRFKDVSFRAWMWQIARNLLIDFRRKRKPDVSLDDIEDEESQPLLDTLVAPGTSPREAVERTDLAKLAMQAVGKLPAVQREVFLMRVQGDLPFNEIAKALKIPLNTALGRMHDATTRLKQLLTKEMK